jgi:putative nucleotidyltransferase with HDIG domain
MRKDVQRLVDDVADLPSMPMVATRIIDLLEDTETTVEQLEEAVVTDQALTAKLIRLANSAEYAFGRPSASAREAILLLGFLQVRNIALTASLTSVFRHPIRSDATFDPDLFWSHSLTVAVAAEAAASNVRTVRRSDAFTAGILHDIGRLLLRELFPKEFEQAGRLAIDSGITLESAEEKLIGYSHCEVGGVLARRWHFPEPLSDAIARHHDPNLTIESDALAGIIAACDRLVLAEGMFCGFYDLPNPDAEQLDVEDTRRLVGGMDRVLTNASWLMEGVVGGKEPPAPVADRGPVAMRRTRARAS